MVSAPYKYIYASSHPVSACAAPKGGSPLYTAGRTISKKTAAAVADEEAARLANDAAACKRATWTIRFGDLEALDALINMQKRAPSQPVKQVGPVAGADTGAAAKGNSTTLQVPAQVERGVLRARTKRMDFVAQGVLLGYGAAAAKK